MMAALEGYLQAGLATKKVKKTDSVEIICFQQIANQLLSEGTVPVPPEPPLRFAMVLYYLSLELSLQRGCRSGGGGGITCRSPLER